MERLGWTANFTHAANGTIAGNHQGMMFADSDVYKLMEAMAWEVGRSGSVDAERRFGELTAVIAPAQEPDGYLNTVFGRPGQPPRYSDLEWGHELYNDGHLFQAAVARQRSSGGDEFVEIARRVADHVCATFGDGGIERVCGHPEVELGLVELARTTGEQRYLDQAALFVERRGRGTLGEIGFGQAYFQDDVPVRDATVFRGHAVRAMYLAAATVDVAVETGDDELLARVIEQWEATIARRTYLTGGMGSMHTGEAFGDDFMLPPDRAYSETCAGIGSVMLAWRLLLATGETRFADLIERTLYNVVATSPAPDGRHFFYANPLHQRVPGHGSERRRREQAGVVEPARAVVPRRLLPDQRGADARQPRRLPGHCRRRRDPDPPVRRQPHRHHSRRRPASRRRGGHWLSRPTARSRCGSPRPTGSRGRSRCGSRRGRQVQSSPTPTGGERSPPVLLSSNTPSASVTR